MATKKNAPVPGVKQLGNNTQMYQVALATALQFIDRLPALITFEITPKASWLLPSGSRKSGYFASLKIYIQRKTGTKTLLDELMLGQLGAPLNGARGINAADVASAIETTLTESVQSYLPEFSTETPGVETQPVSTPLKLDFSKLFPTDSSGRGIDLSNDVTKAIATLFAKITGADLNYSGNLTSYQKFAADWIAQIKAGKTLDQLADERNAVIKAANPGVPEESLQKQGDQLGAAFVQFLTGNLPITGKADPNSPGGLFVDGEAYKYANNPTIYVYRNSQLHGVVGGNAFARYYGKSWDGKADLNTLHKILTMPNLDGKGVPANFFQGDLIK